jgi:DNA transposition AAA+ family ATPase
MPESATQVTISGAAAPLATTEASAVLQARKFRIPGDVVNKATAELPDDQRSLVRWFHAHCAENDLSLKEAGELVRYDDSTLHRIFHGNYAGSQENVCEQIAAFKKLYEERQHGKRLKFIQTDLSRLLWGVFDMCLEFQRVGFVIGESQIGKSASAIEYRDQHNHGNTIYVRMPTGGAKSLFLAYLARALRFGAQGTDKQIIQRIFDAFDDRMLLIVDEVHQCLYSKGEARGASTLEFIRELFDHTGCGLVLIGTPVFHHEMEQGRFAGVLKQLKNRRLPLTLLPARPSARDLNTFAAAYKLPPAANEALRLQTNVVRDEALGMWLTLLRMGAKIASKDHSRMTWSHVLKAHAGLKLLERAS